MLGRGLGIVKGRGFDVVPPSEDRNGLVLKAEIKG